MANHLSYELGLLSKEECKRVEQILQKFILPTQYKIKSVEEFYQAFFLDKKSANQKIRFILAAPLGRGIIKEDVEKSILLKCLEQFV